MALFVFAGALMAEDVAAQVQLEGFGSVPLGKSAPPPPKDSKRIEGLGRAVKGRQMLDVFITPQYDTLAAVPDPKGGTVVTWGLREGKPPGEVRFDTSGYDVDRHYYAVYNDNEFDVVQVETVRLEPYDPKTHGIVKKWFSYRDIPGN